MKDFSIIVVQPNVSGPALALTIRGGTEHFRHPIDVDLVPYLNAPDEFKLSATANSRLDSLFQSNPNGREKVKKARLILVPKKPTKWLLSYSHVTKAVIKNLDRRGECRKKCHKILKYDFLMKIPGDFPGISTHVFKVNSDNKLTQRKLLKEKYMWNKLNQK